MFGNLDLIDDLKVGGALGAEKPLFNKPDFKSLKVFEFEGLKSEKEPILPVFGKPELFSASPGIGPCSLNLPPVQESMNDKSNLYSNLSKTKD